jgi:hypothetical protein
MQCTPHGYCKPTIARSWTVLESYTAGTLVLCIAAVLLLPLQVKPRGPC